MKDNLFLQGDIAVGKSKLIKESLLPNLAKVGGFYVQRIFIGDRYIARTSWFSQISHQKLLSRYFHEKN